MPPLRETFLFYVAIESRRCCISDLKLRVRLSIGLVIFSRIFAWRFQRAS